MAGGRGGLGNRVEEKGFGENPRAKISVGGGEVWGGGGELDDVVDEEVGEDVQGKVRELLRTETIDVAYRLVEKILDVSTDEK